MARSTALVRPGRGRTIAGVCAAFARRFDVKPWQVRLRERRVETARRPATDVQ